MKIKPGEGKVRIFPNSSLRKLARAIRRGKIPDERQVAIDVAMRKAAERRRFYLHSAARRSA
jgi:hypothetical protein